MKSYIHLYGTNSEFTEAYNGPDYKEPWLSLTEENMSISYNKPKLTAITFDSITWVTDVPAKGGTASKDNCEFKVYANYDNGSFLDISSDATVTGELVVPSSKADQRHEVGQLTLTASYSGFSATGNITAYQEAAPDFSMEPLTFNILSAGTINWKAQDKSIKRTIKYKLNDGEWASITSRTGTSAPTINVVEGDKLQFRGSNTQYATSSYYNSFGSSASFEIEGNIMSLIYGDDFKNNSTISSSYAFASLFRGCTKLVSAENLVLPATTLADSCYYYMFYGCTSLTTAPKLPATTLASYCYYGMFSDCTSLTTVPSNLLPATTLVEHCYQDMFYNCKSLTTAPALSATTLAEYCCVNMFQGCTSLTTVPSNLLPATTLASGCYQNMFKGCSKLTTAPALPATTLANYCYNSMFRNCTLLTTAPALPATTLANDCYSNMFQGCTSLATAPALPATTLGSWCYQEMFSNCTSLTTAPELPATTVAYQCCYKMFNGCTSLNYIKCLATDISAFNCTGNWVNGVSSTGTFVKNPDMASWPTGTSGIPTGWDVIDA